MNGWVMAQDSPRILIVEDDADMRETVACYLEEQGFHVFRAADGLTMEEPLAQGVQVVLLDVNLPGEDGFSLARGLRNRSRVGIIMITGRGDLVDRVVGLEVGADDYIGKPFQLRELVARIKALLRRLQPEPAPPAPAQGCVRFDGWVLDPARHSLTAPDGADVGLTTTEFAILCRLASPPGQTVSRQALSEAVKGRDWSPFERSLDVHVGNLRRKLEDNGRHPRLIKSIHGVGYRLAADPANGR